MSQSDQSYACMAGTDQKLGTDYTYRTFALKLVLPLQAHTPYGWRLPALLQYHPPALPFCSTCTLPYCISTTSHSTPGCPYRMCNGKSESLYRAGTAPVPPVAAAAAAAAAPTAAAVPSL
mmetsp:Transcript_25734/g.56065  ORF Transcript_25734/g.56065 Transcript_25734/m.56065 type:complete len:120 (-) Transcript_25734:803-1162(-)